MEVHNDRVGLGTSFAASHPMRTVANSSMTTAELCDYQISLFIKNHEVDQSKDNYRMLLTTISSSIQTNDIINVSPATLDIFIKTSLQMIHECTTFPYDICEIALKLISIQELTNLHSIDTFIEFMEVLDDHFTKIYSSINQNNIKGKKLIDDSIAHYHKFVPIIQATYSIYNNWMKYNKITSTILLPLSSLLIRLYFQKGISTCGGSLSIISK